MIQGVDTHSNCKVTTYELYQDAAATLPWSDPSIFFDSTDTPVNGFHRIRVNKSTSFAKKTLYLQAKTNGQVSFTRRLEVEVVCDGTETVSLVSDAVEEMMYTLNTGVQSIIQDVTTWFSINNHPGCTIESCKVSNSSTS